MHSLHYGQLIKRNNYNVSYHNDGKLCHGQIVYYFTDYSQIFAVVASFTNVMLDFFPKDDITSCTVPQIHVYKGIEDTNVQVILFTSICLCVLLSFSQLPSTTFVIDQPNFFEKD